MNRYVTASLTFFLVANAGACVSSDSEDETGTESGTDSGAGTDTDASVDCANAEMLPDKINEDTVIGPGCFIMNRTTLSEGAEVIIEPGTTILVESAGFLKLPGPASSARLLAKGTADNPILFTANSDDPSPGDWGCIFFGAGSVGSEMEHVVVEYGGLACDATGTSPDTQVFVSEQIDALNSVTVQHGHGHGIILDIDGNVRSFENNVFADNGLASLRVHGNQIVVPADTTVFEDADDYIEVDGDMNEDGTISGQTVPYRFLGEARVGTAGLAPQISVDPGVRLELEGENFHVLSGNMVVNGTADNPVVFTSSRANPAPDDWGCLWFAGDVDGTVTMSHAIIEYAGGSTCGNLNDWDTGLLVGSGADLTSLTFSNIGGHGILVPMGTCPPDSCDHTFTDLEAEPLSCDGMPMLCN